MDLNGLNGLKSQSIPEVETLYLCIIRAKIKLTEQFNRLLRSKNVLNYIYLINSLQLGIEAKSSR